jgi:P4 family phage/plasmid primase-like protien
MRLKPSKLNAFLNGTGNDKDSDKKRYGHVAESGERSTHTAMDGGAWEIIDDDLPEFYKLYCEYIQNHGPLSITEKGARIGAMRVDLDFKLKGVHDSHVHSQKNVEDFVRAYATEVAKFVKVPETVEFVVSEKPEPTVIESKNLSRSGIHIVVPDIKTNKFIEEQVRRRLLPKMDEFFPGLRDQLMNEWKDVYDESVITRNKTWTLLGSKKPESKDNGATTAYKIKYILDWDTESNEFSYDDAIPVIPTAEWVARMSIRGPATEIGLTPEGQTIVEKCSYTDRDPVRISGGRAISAGRGRTAGRGEEDNSRSSSPGRMVYERDLTAQELKYIWDLLDNLKEFRYSERSHWVDVGHCMKNIHSVQGFPLWCKFSQKVMAVDVNQYASDRELEIRWRGFGIRSGPNRYDLRSLRKWSKIDNPEKHAEIEKENLSALIEECKKAGTEHDMALLVRAMYGNEYKCARYGTNVWYHYESPVWRETDKGISLQCRLSKEVAKLFDNKQTDMLKERDKHECECGPKKKGEETNEECEYCKYEAEAGKYANIRTKLKTSRFKENVMKECRELFLDEKLANKLDENKHLIAFANGVFDTLALTFTPADECNPDDYLSFSTNVVYNPDSNHSAYECWAELNKFLTSILPDQSVREYFLRHLSTCLSGSNEAQKFHILTGSGSNGKSMLMNLVSTAFGDYACKAPISLLTQQRNKSAAAAPELVRMKGRRFVTMQEPDEQVPLNTGLMKELASCEKITARDLYAGSKQMIDFDIQARFHLACNEKPKVNTTDGGTWRRLVVIDFPMKFVPHPTAPNELPIDETIVQKVVSEEWAECFAAYLVQLYKDGNGWRKITPPSKVMEYTNEYKVESDVIARFMGEYIHSVFDAAGAPIGDGPPEPTLKGTLTNTFQEWKRTNELGNRASATELVKRVEAVYGKYPARAGWTSFRFGNA